MNGSLPTIIMFVALIGLMYFMMIRPQKKQQQKRQEMMSNLKKGDAVITIGRLHGVIDSINNADHTVTLDCDGIFLTFEQSAIASVIPAKTNGGEIVEKSTQATDAQSTEEVTEKNASEDDEKKS
ncbi:preprotein translocase subunit YajC [Liquorilactobacillus uvarum]|uniref:preprotein translocase subunit YajC n=1 Tax=Liquorilactobacillus uvarum TaxID=303240 RepID=UPI002889B506|nr:preprotein translocase subunit YajC [Liquorilactobacillus uvarum]